ncbi:MAG: methyl-accepting chemotaxis protein [PVC group bacterium]|nr:methyl-accepting chemotaxis protein [PVC group bacterium]
MAKKTLFSRKQLLIQKSLQFKYMMLVLCTILAVTGIIVSTVYFAHKTLIAQQLAGAPSLPDIFNKINMLLLFEVPIFLVIAAWASIVVSHKVAGPVYRLEKIATKMSKGDLTQYLRLRKDDELKDLGTAFNSVIENMQVLVVKDRKLIVELSHLTDRLYSDLKHKKINESEALMIIRRLNDLVGELKALIMQYKVEKGDFLEQ